MLITPNADPIAKIKVIGVGGGGGNAVDTMISMGDFPGVEFMAFNTDAQALKKSLAPTTLQLGPELTKGLGAGGSNILGAQAAEECLDQIHEYLSGSDMVFITAGMGGGTGTGAAPVIAGVAKNLGILTVAVITKPFDFEGKKRMEIAEEGIAALIDKVDTLIVIPNQRLLEVIDESISFRDAMKKVDSVLAEAVKSISLLVSQTGFINVDFADVKSIMTNAGTALMGWGKASGDNRAEEAARMAVYNPLLDMSIEGAKGVLINISGGTSLSFHEVNHAASLISDVVSSEATIIFGANIDEALGNDISVTIIATGFQPEKQALRKNEPSQVRSSLVKEAQPTKLIEDSFLSKSLPTSNKVVQPIITQTINNVLNDEADDKNDEADDLELPAFMRKKK